MDDTVDQTELAEKMALFGRLGGWARDDDGDDAFDSTETSHREKSRGFFKSCPKKSHSEQAPEASVEIVELGVSEKNNVTIARPSKLAEVVATHDTSKAISPASIGPPRQNQEKTQTPRSKRLPEEAGVDTSLRSSKGSKRGKRAVKSATRPQGDQIFRGMTFLYIPNDDINPVRRLRIEKAREYGATRTESIIRATHVIADKNIQYDWAQKMIVSAEFNGSERPALVNENYPIDCIRFKAILDPNQEKYYLEGQALQDTTTADEGQNSEDVLPSSLPLKQAPNNPKRWDYVPMSTPEMVEESQASHRASTNPAPRSNLHVSTGESVLGVQLRPETAMPSHESSIHLKSHDAPNTRPTDETRSQMVKDELSDLILLMQQSTDLPLDMDEDEEAQAVGGVKTHGLLAGSDSEQESGSASASKQNQKNKMQSVSNESNAGPSTRRFEDNFACNHAGGNDDFSRNPNTRTIEVLQRMANYYDQVNDQWRTRAYRMAISTLKRQNVRITSSQQAQRLRNVGPRLAAKIEEIVTTDRLQRLEYAEDEPKSRVLKLFMGVYGAGNSLAQKWYAQGFRTLQDLKQGASLTANQHMGIDHYDDLNTRMPRREVELLSEVVREHAAQIDKSIELIVGGSYRRGSESSGDIDFLVTKSTVESMSELQDFLGRLVSKLEDAQFLVARVASWSTSGRHGGGGGGSGGGDGNKWHGCCVLPETKGYNDTDYRPIWRRIDFLLVPGPEIGAALLYFTGDDIFNRSMRLLARKKGMRLNQRGLYKNVLVGAGRTEVRGELVEGRDERVIFEKLGVRWREPHERWC